ncbi:MAG: twin-arginine translocase TatA/TatE family subunit [Clostridia bacterium]|nr:twin-arginine translocase TatA/TatE family subunit [Clostridia bacterium]
MHKIGMTELLIVLAIALVIFGPKALPKLGRSIGKTIGMFKKGIREDDDAEEDEEDLSAKPAQAKKQPVEEAEDK